MDKAVMPPKFSEMSETQQIIVLRQDISELKAMVQRLAEDYAEQIYGHRGEVVWQDEDGWILVVPASAEAVHA
jgi:hypothetical protein